LINNNIGTKEDIEKETRKILDSVGDVGVIIGADCSLPLGIPTSHLLWVREALSSYTKN
jgi:uroporphyrinogen decarboxylase